MSFVSIEFIAFAALVIPLFFWMRQNLRWLLLLGASYVFYAYWQPSYVLLILFSTLVDYVVALALEGTATENTWRRKLLFACSLTANIGLLFIFKYANLFSQAATDLSVALGMPLAFGALDVLLPVGISFYTFQSMAYTFDVYRGRLSAERHLGIFALYVAFFPQLVAGPIERAGNMLPQFRRMFSFDYDRIVSGMRRILWGVFKKLVIADRLAIYVDAVYGDLESFAGLSLIVATVFFAFQIYCDFSAYSDIAVGVARVLGIRLMENFRCPYLATSLRDFWRRWHISLSTWFRDYVYISLGGNRKGPGRQVLNLLVVFALSGLWHGANWTFLLWGIYHGVIVTLENFFHSRGTALVPRNVLGRAGSLVYTFVLVLFGWILFRAGSVMEIEYVLRHLFEFSQGLSALTDPFAEGLLPTRMEFMLSFLLIVAVLAVDVLDERMGLMETFARMTLVWRWITYYALGFAIFISLFYQATVQEFFYFQF